MASGTPQIQAMMTGSTKFHGLPIPNSKMLPPGKINGGDGRLYDVSPDVLKFNVQLQSGVSPSALVSTSPTIASAELEGQQSSGFHPSVLAS